MYSISIGKIERNSLPIPYKYVIFILLLVAVAIRIFFFNGLVFSDDSYYNWLGYQFANGLYGGNYLGYPIFFLRKLNTLFTAVGFTIFGYGEISSIVFPFTFSILSIILLYKTSFELFPDRKISITAALIIIFFPVDVVFATINFTDLECTFFINLAVYFYLKGRNKKKIKFYILAAISLSLSLLIKEYAYYYALLFGLVLCYELIWKRKIDPRNLVVILIIFLFFVIEGFCYSLLNHDFLYRSTIMKANFFYCYYDFFPYTLGIGQLSSSQYVWKLLLQIFENIKYIFLRRYYLLLPFLSLSEVFLIIKNKKRDTEIILWMTGLVILMAVMTISFTDYRPLELRRIWYIYPLIFPMCLLVAKLLMRWRKEVIFTFISIYILGSLFMCFEFQEFFNTENNNHFKQFIIENRTRIIYTDHLTGYGIGLINKYNQINSIKSIASENDPKYIKDDLLIYNASVIDELKKQGYHLHNKNYFFSKGFEKTASFGKYDIYKKN